MISTILCLSNVGESGAQVTSPPNINGVYPLATNNLVSTNSGTQTTGTLNTLGLNQGVTFDFTGSVSGSANWNSGLSFLNANILQVQAKDSGLSSNFATYTIDFSDDVYGLQFTKGGLDNADETTISFFNDGVQVPVSVSTYVNGVETVSDPNNVIVFAGTNIDIDGAGGNIRADGDGNNDTGGIGIHGLQEQFTIHLPLNVAVDQVVFNQTGKNDGGSGNVTLIYTDFAWATLPEMDVSGLGVSIADGDATPDAADDTDFGTLAIIADSKANTFTITNSGPGQLNLTGTPRVTIAGANAADFALTTDAATSVAAGGANTTFAITFDPSAIGVRTATVSIANDDADENPYNYSIRGTGKPGSAMEVSKSPDVVSVNNAGDVITYTITLTNTGSSSITGITVADPLLTALSCVPGTGPNPSNMASGAVTNCTGTYTVTQADFDNDGGGDGDIDNIATVTANGGISETASAAVTVNTNTDLAITKSADDTTEVVVGQLITYTYVVANNGNLTISDVFLNDTHNGSGPPPVPSNETLTTDNTPLGDSTDATTDGSWDTLAPGDIVTFTAAYTVTQSDVDTLQ